MNRALVDMETGEVLDAVVNTALVQSPYQPKTVHSTEAELELMEQICEIQQVACVSTSGSYRGAYSTEGDINRFVRDFLTPRGIVVRTNAIDGGREVVEVARKKGSEYIRELHNRVWGKFQFVISNGKAEIEHIGYGDWVQDNGLPQFSSVMTNAWRNFMIKTFALEGANGAPITQPAKARQKSQPKPSRSVKQNDGKRSTRDTAQRTMSVKEQIALAQNARLSNTEPTVSSQQISALAKALKTAGFGTDEADKQLGRALLGWLAECEPVGDIRDMPRACAERALARIEAGDINELVEQWNIARVAAEAAKAGERIDAALGTGAAA